MTWPLALWPGSRKENMLFAVTIPTIKIDGKCEIGVLTPLGLEAADFIHIELRDYIRNKWSWNEKTEKYGCDTLKDRRERKLLNWLLSEKGVAIIASDVSQELEFDTIIEWANSDPAFLEKCYKAAIKQNPLLGPIEHLPSQEQTKNSNGEAISKDDAEKKG